MLSIYLTYYLTITILLKNVYTINDTFCIL